MDLHQAVFLAILQGLTEFLPISSSGHLVLFQQLFGIQESMITFDIMVHLGTLLAVFVYFRHDISCLIRDTVTTVRDFFNTEERGKVFKGRSGLRVGVNILVATIPAGFVGIFLGEVLEQAFHSVISVAVAWFVIGLALVASCWLERGERTLEMIRLRDAWFVGGAQALALFPGISRSGATILAGLIRGMEGRAAARFSFLMAIPAILGAAVLKLPELFVISKIDRGILLTAFFVSAIAGLAALAFLMRMIQQSRLHYFGYYCLAMSLVAFFSARIVS